MERIYPIRNNPAKRDVGARSAGRISNGIYLDYAATTPVDLDVVSAMAPYFSDEFGNPNSLHSFGQAAEAALDRARETIARTIGVGFREIIFTGSATEANNLALRGVIKGFRVQGIGFKGQGSEFLNPVPHTLFPKVIVSAVEHESVLETARDLAKDGVDVVEIPVDRTGVIDLGALEKALDERTVLVSIQYANNEIGVVQPITEIVRIIRDFRNSKLETLNPKQIQSSKLKIEDTYHSPTHYSLPADLSAKALASAEASAQAGLLPTHYPLFHADAVQAFQYLDCSPEALGADLLTLSAHKIYGPKGIGALCIGSRVQGLGSSTHGLGFREQRFESPHPNPYTICPMLTGGGQEFGMRAGTQNVAGAVGFAVAAEKAARMRDAERTRMEKIGRMFWEKIRAAVPGVVLNGLDADQRGLKRGPTRKSAETLPNILSISFPRHCARDLVVRLDMEGIAVSAGAACASRAAKESYVLKALGLPEERVKNGVRFSFGRQTTEAEIVEAVRRIGRAVTE